MVDHPAWTDRVDAVRAHPDEAAIAAHSTRIGCRPREQDVVTEPRQLARWCTVRLERMGVAERTVEAHLSQVLAKLGLDGSPDQHRRVLAVLTLLRS